MFYCYRYMVNKDGYNILSESTPTEVLAKLKCRQLHTQSTGIYWLTDGHREGVYEGGYVPLPIFHRQVDSSLKDELPLSRFTGSECFRKQRYLTDKCHQCAIILSATSSVQKLVRCRNAYRKIYKKNLRRARLLLR